MDDTAIASGACTYSNIWRNGRRTNNTQMGWVDGRNKRNEPEEKKCSLNIDCIIICIMIRYSAQLTKGFIYINKQYIL